MKNALSTLKAKKNSKKGFTLMEMLIVVAIIAILVAVAIPVFTSSLNSAKIAADDANLRSAKAVYAVYTLSNSSDQFDVVGETGITGTADLYFNASTGKFQTSTDGAYTAQQSGAKNGQYIIMDSGTGAPAYAAKG